MLPKKSRRSWARGSLTAAYKALAQPAIPCRWTQQTLTLPLVVHHHKTMLLTHLLLLLPLLATSHALPNNNNKDNDDGNTGCATWCHSNFGNPSRDCITPSRSHSGPCFQCGPRASQARSVFGRGPKKLALCRERCCDSSTDSSNCGRCGKSCTGGQVCTDGSCRCAKRGESFCSATGKCQKGSCAPVCASGQVVCNGACVTPTTVGHGAACGCGVLVSLLPRRRCNPSPIGS